MKIADIFRQDIRRDIPEVIKVDFSDEDVVANEIDEYVVTDHIREGFETLLDRYQETILNPEEGTNIWVSGFFGSGKSSFAKIFGYLLANPTIKGRSARERFSARVASARIDAVLNTIHAQAPTHTVFVDLATGTNVAREGESVVLPLYRALLESLGYSRNILLAHLEFELETDDELDAFIDAFSRIPGSKGSWNERRNVGFAVAEASYAMHLLRPDHYPSPESWRNGMVESEINANWFATRALDLLARRGNGAKRILFIVDEVGQYVARSVQRILDLQGLAEAVQKKRGGLWVTVTSQERLEDVVDALEGKRVELPKVQARFPLRVDLLPADIDEVASKRVLDKNAPGDKAVRDAFTPHRHKLSASIRLLSSTRSSQLSEKDFSRPHPLLPYHIQLLIDAVSARRAQGGGSPMLGGSNRTIIKLAQQLLVHPKVGLADQEVGALVTLDRAYELLESIIPTSWQAEIERVGERHGKEGLEHAVARAIALTMDVGALPLDAGNLAVMLHPTVDAESLQGEVQQALDQLVREEVVRQTEAGYRLQSPQEKDWERDRRAIEPRLGDLVRLRREMLKEALRGLSVTEARKFNVGVTVDGESVLDGDIQLVIEEGDERRIAEIRTLSREPASEATIWWVFAQTEETEDALTNAFRSAEMLRRKDTTSRTAEEVQLLGEERNRLARSEERARERLARDLLGGQIVFQGATEEVRGSELRSAVTQAIKARVRDIYPRLDRFAAPDISRKDAAAILKADDLRGLPDYLGDEGIGLLRATPTGVEIVTDGDPLKTFVDEIAQRTGYGNEVTGGYLEKRFSAPPFGASVEVVQVLAAAAIRAGLVEVVSQGQRISKPDDARLDSVLGKLPSYRSASFRLQTTGIDIETRTQVAERIAKLTGESPSPTVEALAPLLRQTFVPDLEASERVRWALEGLGLAVPEAVGTTASIIRRLRDGDDEEAVRTAAETWSDLTAGREVVRRLDDVISRDLDALREAIAETRKGSSGLDDDASRDLESLRDFMRGSDFGDHIAQIKDLTKRVARARESARQAVLEDLAVRVSTERERLRQAFGELDREIFDEAVRPLEALVPAGDSSKDIAVEALRGAVESVPERVTRVRRALEELVAAGSVARIEMLRIVGDTPIATPEDLEVVLKRIREAVEAELGSGKQVYLT